MTCINFDRHPENFIEQDSLNPNLPTSQPVRLSHVLSEKSNNSEHTGKMHAILEGT